MASEENETNDVAAALYHFAAWLTCRDQPVTFSAAHDAAAPADLVGRFCEFNEIPEPNMEASHYKHPPEE